MQAIADTAALTEAYLRERAGYARRGAADKVAEVDVQLARLGYHPEPVPVAAPQSPTEPPRKRTVRKPPEEA